MTLQQVNHFLIVLLCFALSTTGEEAEPYFLIASKSVPRIGRSANKGGNSEFEKFFLKASKSVPRIGRRNEGLQMDGDRSLGKFPLKHPTWSDISYFYEYQPELLASNDPHSTFEQYLLGEQQPPMLDEKY
ncbi:uncharacterized protein [Euwallacea fornicatus]|uniref:uncharacterized protein n=1 Tax=Euwallacea fornicatus TaxID=995702 RepID=UPI00338E279E